MKTAYNFEDEFDEEFVKWVNNLMQDIDVDTGGVFSSHDSDGYDVNYFEDDKINHWAEQIRKELEDGRD